MIKYIDDANSVLQVYVEEEKGQVALPSGISQSIHGKDGGVSCISENSEGVDNLDETEDEIECDELNTVIDVSVEHSEQLQQQVESEEDHEYLPVDESDTDDGLNDNELSDDDEYVEARKSIAKYKNYMPVNELADRLHGNTENARHKASGFVSEYEDSNGDVNSDSTDEDDIEEGSRKRRKRVVYDPRCDYKYLQLVMRSSKYQFQMRCDKGCPWRLYGSMIKREHTFAIKTYVGEHRCPSEMKNRQATSEWIAKEYIHRFRRNANWSVKDLEDDLLDKFCVQVLRTKCYRAKWKALNMLKGFIQEHYAKLRGYKVELLRVDKEGRFDFLLDEDCTFKGFFIGFSSLRKGFLKYCRPIIGFDGCFLKSFLGGALLCAVAKDGNNQMLPSFGL
ncbi:uncharacterized protein LOC107260890 [Ricinus communis]|uniref:uncharacterized protein LOC107260890 n=1 Tax=Ricinus communis TaxID=3988 RepID=UPI00201AE0DF|nr:uncharacterized protein LOC107260890 [Ricinus communis]